MTWKDTNFEWSPDQEKILYKVQAVVDAILLLESHDPESFITLGVLWQKKNAKWSFWQAQIEVQ